MVQVRWYKDIILCDNSHHYFILWCEEISVGTAVDITLEDGTGHVSFLLAANRHVVNCTAQLGKLSEPMGGNSENCQIK
jgi:hypothetical protein